MTVAADRPAAPPAHPGRRKRRGVAVASLLVAGAAGAALLVTGPGGTGPADPPGRLTAAQAWPRAQRADLPGNLADGPLFSPKLFVTASTAVGTAPSPDATALRLVLRNADGSVRELRRLPSAAEPQFDTFTMAGDDIAWTEAVGQRPPQIWAVNLRDGKPARQLTADTGNAVFYGNQYDLVIADGRVHWTAAPGANVTEIRSVPLTGGRVEVRPESGEWALSAWPWLTDDAGNQSGTTVLRNLRTGRDVIVAAAGADLTTCSPTWCRVMVTGTEGLIRVDLMRPDGTARRRIAGGNAQTAVTDVAVLDRFEILSEPGPDSDLTGTAGLVVYDIRTGRTVVISPAADGAFTRGGFLWWSTGNDEVTVWHSLDLRTA